MCLLESILSRLAMSEISIFYLVSVAEKAALKLTLLETPDRFSCSPFGPRREKTCFRVFGNNKGTDQPAHPGSLISAFVIRFLESII